jgi:hypothetical protein
MHADSRSPSKFDSSSGQSQRQSRSSQSPKYQPVFSSIGATPSTVDLNQLVTLSADLNGSSSAPTGTMTFYDNGTALSGTVSYTPQVYSLIAIMTYTPTTAGNHAITVGNSGDSNYWPTTSGQATLTVLGPTFSISANPKTVTVSNPGASGSTTLTFAAMNGLSGTFNLMPQCAGLPAKTTCSVSPTSISLNSNTTTITATLTISTTGSSAATPGVQNWPYVVRPGTIIAITLLAFPLVFTLVRKRRRIQFAITLLAFAFLLTIASCGGGGNSGDGGGGGNSGTPVGLDSSATVSFTLGTATQSVPFSINVE